MRIEGYIEHPEMKITVMKMNNRYTVKFEKSGMEQSYKYYQSNSLTGMGDVKNIIDSNFQTEVLSIFNKMLQLKNESIPSSTAEPEEDFPNII